MNFSDFNPGGNETVGGFLNDTTSEKSSKKNVRRLQSVVPVCIRQIKECEDEEFKLFGMNTQILCIVGIVRDYEIQSTKATYSIEDHTGALKAIWWLENDSDTVPNLPAVKEGNYVQIFGSLRSQEGQKNLMVLRMFPVTDANIVTNHLLQVIHVRLAAEAMSKNTFINIKANNPGAALASSMSFMDDDMNGGGSNMGLTPLQEKVFKLLQANNTPEGMDRATLLRSFPANQQRAVNDALEFLNNEGHAYSTVDNDHFKVTN